MKTLYAMPGHLIRRAHQISTAIFAEECAAYDLTAIQYAALSAIRSHADLDATRLSGVIAFDRTTIGGVLDRLEAKSWIKREPSPTDRRIKLIRLTPDGGKLLEEVATAVARVQERLLEPLEGEDRATFLRLLERLTDVHNDLTSAPLQALSEAGS
ncbi:MarR family winged helix-turn-helix transcriptional regulator [Rhizobium sp. RAF56]|jgi:DNA-binding MarR family transcriptional regulator|uniref:MarR family winged helix-turn-helix transcriptional regulator n=1 Tax=Rhizobium sp. RAF56 TaxID=3233062 RepID=UPI003F99EF03